MPKFAEYSDRDLFYHHTLDEAPDPNDFTMHNHSSYEIYYFISGRGCFYIEGNEYPLQSGYLLIMRGSEAHYIAVKPDAAYERFALHFDRSLVYAVDGEGLLLEPFDARATGRGNLFTQKDFKDGLYLALLQNIMSAPPENRRLQALSNLFALLNEIRRAHLRAKTRAVPESESLAQSVIGYINANLSRPISLDGICKRFYISKAQLCRLFKKTAGASVWEYVTAKRLSAARKMLQSGVPATSAFGQCGFADYSAFYRAYVKRFGCAPSQTRRDGLKADEE
ncbi:MAG: AraC family transcriptional regulator [Butyrivibrio sp.]|nr:AraC family transcriptional regulator [Butyrivibrio sp.]